MRYKICDYRPVFGLAFKDYLEGYDFWGQCDIDLVFGDIRKFVTDDVLSNYDKIYNRGYITFYRNNKQMQELFLQKHDYPFYRYDEAFRTNYVCHFDENAICRIADALEVKIFNEITYADIDFNCNNFKLCFIQDQYPDQIWKWEKIQAVQRGRHRKNSGNAADPSAEKADDRRISRRYT